MFCKQAKYRFLSGPVVRSKGDDQRRVGRRKNANLHRGIKHAMQRGQINKEKPSGPERLAGFLCDFRFWVKTT